MHIFIGMFPKRGRSLHLFMAERKFVFTKHKKSFNQKDACTNSYLNSSKYIGMQILTPNFGESIYTS